MQIDKTKAEMGIGVGVTLYVLHISGYIQQYCQS